MTPTLDARGRLTAADLTPTCSSVGAATAADDVVESTVPSGGAPVTLGDATAVLVREAGGVGIGVQVDHLEPEQVREAGGVQVDHLGARRTHRS